jgi:hypothetical protein
MDLRAVLSVTVLAVALYNGWQRFELRAVRPADGMVAPDEPRQSATPDPAVIRRGRWELTPRADYEITARILSREDYRFDHLADLAPQDLALGWGPMSDNQVLGAFDIEQSARFYSWRPHGILPVPRETVVSHSANTHLIPADDHIRAQLARLRVGEVVHLGGVLVDGRRDDGAWIRTSLTRTDSGAGACEVLLVRSVEVQ